MRRSAHGKVFLNGAETDAGRAAIQLARRRRAGLDGPPGLSEATPDHCSICQSPSGQAYEDEALVVLDKPAGLLAVPLDRRSGARHRFFKLLEDHLRSHNRRPFVVHRMIAIRLVWWCSRKIGRRNGASGAIQAPRPRTHLSRDR